MRVAKALTAVQFKEQVKALAEKYLAPMVEKEIADALSGAGKKKAVKKTKKRKYTKRKKTKAAKPAAE